MLRCLPDELDRQDDARIQEIVLYLNALAKRRKRDAAASAGMAKAREGG